MCGLHNFPPVFFIHYNSWTPPHLSPSRTTAAPWSERIRRKSWTRQWQIVWGRRPRCWNLARQRQKAVCSVAHQHAAPRCSSALPALSLDIGSQSVAAFRPTRWCGRGIKGVHPRKVPLAKLVALGKHFQCLDRRQTSGVMAKGIVGAEPVVPIAGPSRMHTGRARRQWAGLWTRNTLVIGR